MKNHIRRLALIGAFVITGGHAWPYERDCKRPSPFLPFQGVPQTAQPLPHVPQQAADGTWYNYQNGRFSMGHQMARTQDELRSFQYAGSHPTEGFDVVGSPNHRYIAAPIAQAQPHLPDGHHQHVGWNAQPLPYDQYWLAASQYHHYTTLRSSQDSATATPSAGTSNVGLNMYPYVPSGDHQHGGSNIKSLSVVSEPSVQEAPLIFHKKYFCIPQDQDYVDYVRDRFPESLCFETGDLAKSLSTIILNANEKPTTERAKDRYEVFNLAWKLLQDEKNTWIKFFDNRYGIKVETFIQDFKDDRQKEIFLVSLFYVEMINEIVPREGIERGPLSYRACCVCYEYLTQTTVKSISNGNKGQALLPEVWLALRKWMDRWDKPLCDSLAPTSNRISNATKSFFNHVFALCAYKLTQRVKIYNQLDRSNMEKTPHYFNILSR